VSLYATQVSAAGAIAMLEAEGAHPYGGGVTTNGAVTLMAVTAPELGATTTDGVTHGAIMAGGKATTMDGAGKANR